ncbi:MAG: TIGR03667 family PPOX class F420-dependent oxidoreductase [Chloroflexota bacterium]
MSLPLDPQSPFSTRVLERLGRDQIAWLVTVDADGTPQPSPVWFLWEQDSLLIFSRPAAPKIRNIAARPRVAVHFDGDHDGGDIVVLTGMAAADPTAPAADAIPAYVEKYRAGIASLGMTPAAFAADYSAAIRVHPASVRGH